MALVPDSAGYWWLPPSPAYGYSLGLLLSWSSFMVSIYLWRLPQQSLSLCIRIHDLMRTHGVVVSLCACVHVLLRTAWLHGYVCDHGYRISSLCVCCFLCLPGHCLAGLACLAALAGMPSFLHGCSFSVPFTVYFYLLFLLLFLFTVFCTVSLFTVFLTVPFLLFLFLSFYCSLKLY